MPEVSSTTGTNANITDQNQALGLTQKGAASAVHASTSDTPPPPPVYVSPRESKKAKKGSSPKKDNKMALLAGSEPGRRQAQ